MWVLWFVICLIESLLFIVLVHGGAIDSNKASAAVQTSMSKLAALFKPKPKE